MNIVILSDSCKKNFNSKEEEIQHKMEWKKGKYFKFPFAFKFNDRKIFLCSLSNIDYTDCKDLRILYSLKG